MLDELVHMAAPLPQQTVELFLEIKVDEVEEGVCGRLPRVEDVVHGAADWGKDTGPLDE